jgi:acyl transferase domain-containing protein
MGAELITEYEVFRNSIQYQDAILLKLSCSPLWTIEGIVMSPSRLRGSNSGFSSAEVLLEPPATSRIQEPEFSQMVCTALQIALVDLLRSWGVEPVATVGHSSGMASLRITFSSSTNKAQARLPQHMPQAVTLLQKRSSWLTLEAELWPKTRGRD